MNSLRYGGLLVGLLLLATGASAQGLGGLWGSPLYQVQLTVNGSQVTGSFTFVDKPKAQPGTLSGELKAGGKSFTAEWKFPAGPEQGSFSTLLELSSNGRLLTGYRWTEESLPAAFSLHRAVNGKVPELVDENSVPDKPGSTPPTTTPPPTPPQPPVTVTPPAGTPGLEIIICESIVDGQPHNVRNDFTAPKSIVAYVRYSNLPANSSLDWVWTLDGRTEAKLNKVLSGSGWHCHGLQSQTAIIPGNYQVAVSLNGRVVAQRTVVVRGPATTTAPPTPPPATAPTGIRVTVCERVVDGQPQNIGTSFTKPQSVSCLVNYEKLPADTTLNWVWTRGGSEIARHEKIVAGDGWVWHGLTSTTALTPGNYEVAVYSRQSLVKRVSITIR